MPSINLKGFRTFIVAAAIAGLGLLQSMDFTSFLDAKSAGLAMIAIGALIATLRTMTTTPAGVAAQAAPAAKPPVA